MIQYSKGTRRKSEGVRSVLTPSLCYGTSVDRYSSVKRSFSALYI